MKSFLSKHVIQLSEFVEQLSFRVPLYVLFSVTKEKLIILQCHCNTVCIDGTAFLFVGKIEQ